MNVFERTRAVVRDSKVVSDFPLADYTAFRTGGRADTAVFVKSLSDMTALCRFYYENDIEFTVLGKGSNVLVSDAGLRVPLLITDFNAVALEDGYILRAQAGCALSAVAAFAARNSLRGLEFAAGIPGSLGGGLIMNAGAYGSELKDFVQTVEVFDKTTGVTTADAKDACFSYRDSAFARNGQIVLGCTLKLERGYPNDIYARMRELAEKRRQKQPLGFPSAGSTFKRPPGCFSGALIESCGLKGRRVGGARVSEKHAGFIVNSGGATSRDVLDLINIVINEVAANTGVTLEPEIKFIGDFDDEYNI